MRGSIQVLQLYIIIFAPLLWFLFQGEIYHFIVYGAVIALGNTFLCLSRQIQADLKANQRKGKRG